MYSLPIYQLDAPPQEGGKLVAMYESVTACAKHLGFNHNGSVSKRCDGKIKSEPYLVYEHDWVLNRHKLISRR